MKKGSVHVLAASYYKPRQSNLGKKVVAYDAKITVQILVHSVSSNTDSVSQYKYRFSQYRYRFIQSVQIPLSVLHFTRSELTTSLFPVCLYDLGTW